MVEGGHRLQGHPPARGLLQELEKGCALRTVETKSQGPITEATEGHFTLPSPSLSPHLGGFSLFFPVQPFLVIVGQTPSMTHPGLGFLPPATSPSQLLGAPWGLWSSPLPIWEDSQEPLQLGWESKKGGAGTLPTQAPPTLPCLCDFAHLLFPARGPPICKSCSSPQDHLLREALPHARR